MNETQYTITEQPKNRRNIPESDYRAQVLSGSVESQRFGNQPFHLEQKTQSTNAQTLERSHTFDF
jgi:hypothetical protein